jgi:uncharacterized protein YaiE (UPF0345 family)
MVPMANPPTEFHGVTAVAKANVYFDGKVASHTILFPDGKKKTLGLIYPGKYHFGTDSAERMEITAGRLRTSKGEKLAQRVLVVAASVRHNVEDGVV